MAAVDAEHVLDRPPKERPPHVAAPLVVVLPLRHLRALLALGSADAHRVDGLGAECVVVGADRFELEFAGAPALHAAREPDAETDLGDHPARLAAHAVDRAEASLEQFEVLVRLARLPPRVGEDRPVRELRLTEGEQERRAVLAARDRGDDDVPCALFGKNERHGSICTTAPSGSVTRRRPRPYASALLVSIEMAPGTMRWNLPTDPRSMPPMPPRARAVLVPSR